MEIGGWSSWQVFTLIFCIVTVFAIVSKSNNDKKQDK